MAADRQPGQHELAAASCPRCGQWNPPYTMRCIRCDRPLHRPRLLQWITTIAPVALLILAVAYAVQIREKPATIPGFVVSCTGVVLLVALRFGPRWAWVAVQVQWLFEILVLGIQGLNNHPATAVGAVFHGVAIALLWCCVQTREVRAYCGLGPVRRAGRHPDADLLDNPDALEQAEEDLHDDTQP